MEEFFYSPISYLPTIIAALVTYILCRIGEGRYMLVTPNERSAHTIPTSSFGGIAIYAGVLSSLLMGYFFFQNPDFYYAITIFSCASILWLIGVIDDEWGLSAKVRLLGQSLFSIIVIYVFDLQLPLPESVSFLSTPLMVFMICAFINATNFSDAINGLLAGTVLVWLFFIANLNHMDPAFTPYIGAVFAYFILNFPSGRIFMGDSGSTFLGGIIICYTLSMCNVMGHTPQTYYSLVLMAISPLVFVFSDVFITLLKRILRGNHPFDAHKEHYMQVLTHIFGYSHAKITIIYLLGSLFSTIMLGYCGFRGHLFWALPIYAMIQIAYFLVLEKAVSYKSKE